MDTPEILAARQKVFDLRNEERCLSNDIQSMSAEIEVKRRRRGEILGGFSSSGELGAAERALKAMLRAEDDKVLPVVVWAASDCWHKETWVVEKVTAKRIFVRLAGTDRTEQFAHGGTSPRRYESVRIDIAATFPNGIKRSDVPETRNG